MLFDNVPPFQIYKCTYPFTTILLLINTNMWWLKGVHLCFYKINSHHIFITACTLSPDFYYLIKIKQILHTLCPFVYNWMAKFSAELWDLQELHSSLLKACSVNVFDGSWINESRASHPPLSVSFGANWEIRRGKQWSQSLYKSRAEETSNLKKEETISPHLEEAQVVTDSTNIKII